MRFAFTKMMALAALAVATNSVSADVITFAGVTVDTTNIADTVEVTEGTPDVFGSSSGDTFDPSPTLGDQAGLNTPTTGSDASIGIGNAVESGVITLGFDSPFSFNNMTVFENGAAGAPEGFVAQLLLESGDVTDFIWREALGFELFPGQQVAGAFATLFTAADFGIAAGSAITGVVIRNILAEEQQTFGTSFADGRLDPDITFVAFNGPTDIPVPAPLAFIGMGLLGLAAARRRLMAN